MSDMFFVLASQAIPDTTPPSQVTGITISLQTENSFRASWNASTDNVAVTDYQVTISYMVGEIPTVLIYYTTNLLYNFTGLTTGVQYTVSVRARDAAGNISSPSANVSVTLTTVDTTPPSQVINLYVANSIDVQLDLDWSAATDNIGVTGYDIQYSLDSNTWYVAGTSNNQFYSFIGSEDTYYYFRVRAYDAAGNVGTWSAVAGAWTGGGFMPI